MDRRELADIGLNPSDLRDASALPLDRDPTALLARRARERRLTFRRPEVTSNMIAAPLDELADLPGRDRPPSRPEPKRPAELPKARPVRTG